MDETNNTQAPQLNPEAFKQRIVSKYPNGVSSDGTKYADMDATTLTQKIASKYPNGTTNDGHKYSDFLPPQTAGQKAVSATTGALSPIGDFAKKAVNFLFPAVGDISDIVQGKNKKTGLQIAGDVGLSALPFIPGLGEAGEGATALETAIKGAKVGYGAGVAQNLASGKGLVESATPNATNIVGGLAGGAVSGLLAKAPEVVRGMSGISPQVQTELERMSGAPENEALRQSYIDATKAHAVDPRAKAPLVMAADELDKAAEKVSSKVDEAGKVVGDAKAKSANAPLFAKNAKTSLNGVGDEFWKTVNDKFGLNLFTKPNGDIIAKPVEGRLVQNDPSVVKRIVSIAQQLSDLNRGDATVGNASDIMGNLNKLVDFSKQDIYGNTNDPIEGLIKNTAGNLNEVVRERAPNIAKANDTFSGLKGLQDEIKKMAGGDLNRGELLMRRAFTGDKSGQVQDFFKKILDTTGIDLMKHASLAKYAIEAVGGNADKTLLEQIMNNAVQSGGGGGILDAAKNLGSTLARKTVANPEVVGKSLTTGELPGLVSLGKRLAVPVATRSVTGYLGRPK